MTVRSVGRRVVQGQNISRVFPGHFYRMYGPLLVEMTGHDNSAAFAVYLSLRI